MVLMNLFAGQEYRCRHRKQTRGHRRGRGAVNCDRSTDFYAIHHCV